jgi:hypothetical protein
MSAMSVRFAYEDTSSDEFKKKFSQTFTPSIYGFGSGNCILSQAFTEQNLIGRRMLPSIIPKFDHRQYGALKDRSTNHALIDVIHMCHQAVDQHQSARCLFIDLVRRLTTLTMKLF